MKTFALCLFCLLVALRISAQESDPPATPKTTQQIGITASYLAGQPGVFGIDNIRHPGKAVSLNWGMNTFTGQKRKGKIGLNVQLDYATATGDFERLEGGFIRSRINDTLRDVRGGHLEYECLSLLIPVYYRYYFGEKFFASINLGARLSLYDDVEFTYTEFDYVLPTDEVINLQDERIEQVDQRFINSSTLIGLGLSFEKLEIELKVGGRAINYKHSHLFPDDRTEISITGMYKL